MLAIAVAAASAWLGSAAWDAVVAEAAADHARAARAPLAQLSRDLRRLRYSTEQATQRIQDRGLDPSAFSANAAALNARLVALEPVIAAASSVDPREEEPPVVVRAWIAERRFRDPTADVESRIEAAQDWLLVQPSLPEDAWAQIRAIAQASASAGSSWPRQLALLLIAGDKDPRSRSILRDVALHEADHQVRREAARGLGSGEPSELDQQALEWLAAFDPVPRVRTEAHAAIARIRRKATEAVEPR